MNTRDRIKVYISGPINSGDPSPEALRDRKHMFTLCEDWIKGNTPMTPVNPLKVGACPREAGSCGPFDGHTWECWLRYDLIAMLKCHAIVTLPGWAHSRGAQLEVHVARELGLKEYLAGDDGSLLNFTRRSDTEGITT